MFECITVTRAVSGVRREATSAGVTTPYKEGREREREEEWVGDGEREWEEK